MNDDHERWTLATDFIYLIDDLLEDLKALQSEGSNHYTEDRFAQRKEQLEAWMERFKQWTKQ